MSMNLEVLSGQTQVSCSNPAPAQEYSDPPLLIGFTNLQLAGSSIYQEYFIIYFAHSLCCSGRLTLLTTFPSRFLVNSTYSPGTVNPKQIRYIPIYPRIEIVADVTMRKC
jgi:hypothetical protein